MLLFRPWICNSAVRFTSDLSWRTQMACSRLTSSLYSSLLALCFGLSVSPTLAQDVIKFGAPLPLTGPLATEAIKQQQGHELWVGQADKAGGTSVGVKKYKVEIVYADFQSNTPRAVQSTEQLGTQNNVKVLV